MGRRLYLALELSTVFLIVPILLFLARHSFLRFIIPTLLLAAALCLLVLWRDPTFDRTRLWNSKHLGRHLRRTLLVFLPAAAAIALLVALSAPASLLQLPRERPRLWVQVLLFYPLLSVYPQEIIFRAFFFHRYSALFLRPRLEIVASAVAFGLAHLFFGNWIALLLSTCGGLLFAATYQRSNSTLAAFLEHSLWGDFVFTVGLGWYFYGGSIVLVMG